MIYLFYYQLYIIKKTYILIVQHTNVWMKDKNWIDNNISQPLNVKCVKF